MLKPPFAMAAMHNAFTLLTGAEQQLNKKKKNKKSAANVSGPPTAPAPVAPQPASILVPAVSNDLVVGVNEACAIFERAAREAKSLPDKVKLWKEWTRLVRSHA